jgi:hypothetical protein
MRSAVADAFVAPDEAAHELAADRARVHDAAGGEGADQVAIRRQIR